MNSEVQAMYARMRRKLEGIVPDAELREKAEIAVEIEHLKKERRAVILGHNYMEAALYHSVPDFVGDSLGLSRLAAQTDKDVIVFCGVGFMAETAKILNPAKTVLIPSQNAGCSLADSITAADVRALKARFPGVPVVTYINTYAEVKAESDYCCTSGNAARLVRSLESDTVIFLPDEYLARNVAAETGKRLITARNVLADPHAALHPGDLVAWHGRCEVHERYSVETIRTARRKFPDVVVLAHPECSPEVVSASDFAGSTSAMIRYVEEHPAQRYLLLTERAMSDNLAALHRGAEFLHLGTRRCPHMHQITLENTLEALRHLRYEVRVPEDIRRRALKAVERMLAVG